MTYAGKPFYEYPDEVHAYLHRLNELFRRVDASNNFKVTGVPGRFTGAREQNKYNQQVKITISHPNLETPYGFSTSIVYFAGDSLHEELNDLETELEEIVNNRLHNEDVTDQNIKHQLDRRHHD